VFWQVRVYDGRMPVNLVGRLTKRGKHAVGDRCPIDRAMQVVGTRSAMLLMREAYYGTTRFDDFAGRVGITEAVAANRLRELVDAGLLARAPYREPGQRTRHEYVLTESGNDLMPALFALGQWGAKHLPKHGSPTLSHLDCGERVTVQLRCAEGHDVPMESLVVAG
jgi:DNA-binding HxlR family transcriptional regulator